MLLFAHKLLKIKERKNENPFLEVRIFQSNNRKCVHSNEVSKYVYTKISDVWDVQSSGFLEGSLEKNLK